MALLKQTTLLTVVNDENSVTSNVRVVTVSNLNVSKTLKFKNLRGARKVHKSYFVGTLLTFVLSKWFILIAFRFILSCVRPIKISNIFQKFKTKNILLYFPNEIHQKLNIEELK